MTVEEEAASDQAQAELEACLRAAARVHGAGIYVKWSSTGRRARIGFALDTGRRLRRWRVARRVLLAFSFGLLAGNVLARVFGDPNPVAARWCAVAAVLSSCAYLACAWWSSRLSEPTPAEVVATATGLADRFDIQARWSESRGLWEITYERRYTS